MLATHVSASATTPSENADREALAARVAQLDAAARRCSAWRLGSFVAFVAGLVAGIESPLALVVVSTATVIIFVTAFVLHGRALEEKSEAEGALTLLLERLRRANERHGGREPPQVPETPTPLEEGRRIFATEPASHPIDSWIADDLDVLRGPRSLFGLLDWTSTTFGARRLRYMLLNPLATAADVRRRQEAVDELASRDPIRAGLLTRLLPARQHTLEPLTRFLHDETCYPRRPGLLLWCHIAGTIVPLLLLVLLLTGKLELIAPLGIGLVLNLGVVGKHSRESSSARDRLLLLRPFLDACLRVQPTLDSLQAPAWKEIAGVLDGLEGDLRRLKRRLDLLAFHSYGVLFEIVNVLTLWELRLLPSAAGLFAHRRTRLQHAAGALGETEALLCLALRLAEDDGFVVPTVVEAEEPLIEADGMGHPLLEAQALVRNPLSLGSETNVWILTGSNMSGKSTYLKSAGLNLLLAGAGGAVCARQFRWTPLALHCDINVRDSLDDGKSYFQVEVERVLNIVRAADTSPKLVALFDELFRGTNSEERVAISRALLRYLGRRGVLVLAATHDRALADLVTIDRENGMANHHLRETVESGVMRFDYRLRDGVVSTRNAIRVLESQGYPEALVSEARQAAGEASPRRDDS